MANPDEMDAEADVTPPSDVEPDPAEPGPAEVDPAEVDPQAGESPPEAGTPAAYVVGVIEPSNEPVLAATPDWADDTEVWTHSAPDNKMAVTALEDSLSDEIGWLVEPVTLPEWEAEEGAWTGMPAEQMAAITAAVSPTGDVLDELEAQLDGLEGMVAGAWAVLVPDERFVDDEAADPVNVARERQAQVAAVVAATRAFMAGSAVVAALPAGDDDPEVDEDGDEDPEVDEDGGEDEDPEVDEDAAEEDEEAEDRIVAMQKRLAALQESVAKLLDLAVQDEELVEPDDASAAATIDERP